MRVVGVKQAEDRADREDDGIGPKAPEKHLESEAVKYQFFRHRSAEQEDRQEENGSPTGFGVRGCRYHVRQADNQGGDQHQYSRTDASGKADHPVPQSIAIPGEAYFGQFAAFHAAIENAKRDGVGKYRGY